MYTVPVQARLEFNNHLFFHISFCKKYREQKENEKEKEKEKKEKKDKEKEKEK